MTDQERIGMLEAILGTLISWIASSSNAPISPKEAETLLKMLPGNPHSENKG